MSIETAVVFGTDQSLVGVVAEPPAAAEGAGAPAVLFLNSGLIHHIGPNRLHVRLARQLAASGMFSLRFDLSGVGDSRASTNRSSLAERRVAEVRAAMDLLATRFGVERFVLVGNCSGAATAILAGSEDARVVGLGLINPQGRRTLRYFLRLAASNPKSWLRLFNGRAKIPRFRRRVRSSATLVSSEVPAPDFVGRMQTLGRRGVEMLLVSCEWDPSYDFFHHRHRKSITSAGLRERVTIEVVRGANHDFTLLSHQERLIELVQNWTGRLRMQRGQVQPRSTVA